MERCMPQHIRNSAKAIILDEGRVLLLQKELPNSPAFTVFPGGGQDLGESLTETLERECLEEIAAEVKVKDLLFVREYRSWRHEFAGERREVHQMEFFFFCELVGDYQPSAGREPDPAQKGVVWVALEDLEKVNLYPKVLRKLLPEKLKEIQVGKTLSVYLGDVN